MPTCGALELFRRFELLYVRADLEEVRDVCRNVLEFRQAKQGQVCVWGCKAPFDVSIRSLGRIVLQPPGLTCIDYTD